MKKAWFVIDLVAIGIGGIWILRELLFLITILSGGYYQGNLYDQYVGHFYNKWIFQYGIRIAVGLVLVWCGSASILRMRRYRFYKSLVSTMPYITVEELAKETGYARTKVARDIRGMLRRNYIPGVKADRIRGCLFLRPEAWQEYEKEREQWDFTRLKLRAAGISPEAYLRVLQAREQLGDIEGWNAKIQDAKMQKQLKDITERLDVILSEIKEAPEKLYIYNKIYSFYLPQLLQLTKQYAQLETLGVQVQDSDCAGAIRAVLADFPYKGAQA
ncbi:MAG: 5-bromo-4-chloroindolyl phosphate hydrolysis family protein [Lachnospiraceae bacterium]|nr:5-bromo-4-chloroindolyl phosphate hydrolysis family protein [Lachnospiraceae bacterium]